ncbi:MAG TPA: cell wall-binding repeat-containing protein [Microbacterium sp.]|nr:cell wall-binding repeat-containing protein [Microbacterium sp.]
MVAVIASTVLVAGLLVVAGGASASAATATEVESNDEVSTANPLPLGTTMHGTAYSSSDKDQDYYVFDVPESGQLHVDLQFPAGLQGLYAYEVEIQGARGDAETYFRWVPTPDWSDGTRLRSQAPFLQAGRYWLLIAAAPGMPTWNQPYSLTLTSTPGFVETEHRNNSSGTPDALALRQTILGSSLTAWGRDEDWFTFDVPEDGRAIVDFRFPAGLSAGKAYSLMLHGNSSGLTYAWDVDASASDGALIRNQGVFLRAGRYEVQVLGKDTWAGWGAPYSLNVDVSPGFVEAEPNYTSLNATALPLGKAISGSALSTPSSDIDWFRFEMPEAGAAQLDFTFPADLGSGQAYTVAVNDAHGQPITTFEVSGPESNGDRLRSLPVPLPAGPAFVSVLALSSWASWGDVYTLSVNAVPVPHSTVTRLAGVNRYETSVAVSRASFASGVSAAYVASGADFPDALAGAPAAATRGAPMLLVEPSTVPAVVAVELQRLKPGRIVVLGGVGVVSAAVEKELQRLTGASVTRLAGADRYATSVAISKAAFPAGAKTAYLANGSDFPDALSGAPLAGMTKGPVLLVEKNTIPAVVRDELKRLGITEAVMLGGNGVISPAAFDQITLRPLTGRWLGGIDRYGTSAEIAQYAFLQSRPAVAYIASGESFPDALSAAPAAGMNKGPVLLVTPDTIPPATQDALRRLKPSKIVVLGGQGAVSASVESNLAQYAIP